MRLFRPRVTDLNGSLLSKDRKTLEEAAKKKFGDGRFIISGPDAKKQFSAIEKPLEPQPLKAAEVQSRLVDAEKNRSLRGRVEELLRAAGDDPSKWYQHLQDDMGEFPEVNGDLTECWTGIALGRIMRKWVKANERVRAMQSLILSLPAQLQPQALHMAHGVIAGFDPGRDSVPKPQPPATSTNGAAKSAAAPERVQPPTEPTPVAATEPNSAPKQDGDTLRLAE